jgi:hypothetical protein
MADQVAAPALKAGWKSTEAWLSLIGLFIAAWGVYALTSLLPEIVKALPANPQYAGIIALGVSGATAGLGWLAKHIIVEYTNARTKLKLPSLPLPPGGFVRLAMLFVMVVLCLVIAACSHLTPFEAGEVQCAQQEAAAVEALVPQILSDLSQQNWVALLDQLLVSSGPAAACAINTAIAQLKGPSTAAGAPTDNAAKVEQLQTYAASRGITFK